MATMTRSSAEVEEHAPATVRSLVGWIALCAGGGALIGAWTSGGGDPWYQALQKPSFNPPPSVFAPVWTALYIAMGTAAWLVWQRPPSATRRAALTLFLAQLAVNFAWSPIFFTAHAIDAALLTIVILWVLIVATMAVFATLSRRAMWLLAPYLAWVTFASVLNATLARLN